MKTQKVGLKEMLAYEKTQMLPLRFVMSYIVTPIYGLLSVLLIAAFAIMMEIDERQYFIPGMLCLGAFVLISIVLLVSVPLVRKKEISIELRRYDFDASKAPALEEYDFSSGDTSLKFDKYGMHVNGKLIYYNHLSKKVVTSKDCKRVGIYLQFALTEEQYVMLYVNPTTLKMLECLNIQLDNRETLDYILSNPKEAFEQIYNTGDVLCS